MFYPKRLAPCLLPAGIGTEHFLDWGAAILNQPLAHQVESAVFCGAKRWCSRQPDFPLHSVAGGSLLPFFYG
jgi:hypothetical protein